MLNVGFVWENPKLDSILSMGASKKKVYSAIMGTSPKTGKQLARLCKDTDTTGYT